jgi:superfamily II DNA helicase RecQ
VQETFKKDGKVIQFRKLRVTEAGHRATAEDLARFKLRETARSASSGRRRRRKSGKPLRKGASARPVSTGLFEALKEWRLEVARKKRIPAFRILTDAVLRGICEASPISEEELLEVKGIGPALVARYGEAVLGIVRSHPGSAISSGH